MTFLTFRAPVSSFYWFYFLLTLLLCSAFHLSILSEVKLNFLRQALQEVSDVPAGERNAVQQWQWGMTRRLASNKSQTFLQPEQIKVWRGKVSTFSGACRWARQEDAKPRVIQYSERCVHTSRVLALNARANFWEEILGPLIMQFLLGSSSMSLLISHPQENAPAFLTFSVRMSKNGHENADKGGWTWWSSEFLSSLPALFNQALSDVACLHERKGSWSEPCCNIYEISSHSLFSEIKLASSGQMFSLFFWPCVFSMRLISTRTLLLPTLQKLSIPLAGSYARLLQHEPSSKSILYLDDRTIMAPNREVLLRTCQSWQQLYNFTPLKNNDAKRLFFTRNILAFVDMQEHGIDVKPHAQVPRVSVGWTPRKRTSKEIQKDRQILRCCAAHCFAASQGLKR